MKEKKIAHILPTLEIGGAEMAALSISIAAAKSELNYRIFVIKKYDERLLSKFSLPQNVVLPSKVLFSYNLGLLIKLIKYKPDIIISSMWKSVPVALFLSFFHDCKKCFFMHSTRFFHIFDRFVSTFAIKKFDLVLVDSRSSEEFLGSLFKKIKIMPFYLVLRKLKKRDVKYRKHSFVFVGRIDPVKNIERALDVFYEYHKSFPMAHFDIYGPEVDMKYLSLIKCKIITLGLEDKVSFKGVLDFDNFPKIISTYQFYLQFSHMEGMAISVMEAMQLGLVPVVSPVGEIGQYCQDEHNAIFDSHEVVNNIIRVSQNDKLYGKMSKAASCSFEYYPCISSSLIKLINHE
ncbi:glycosyltransferase family 4 protein [Vibrio parahaemolyticus]|nr:glycosyltransferase family 4 protein [Vibrio parahaemolyticus]HCH1627994.1 glycosyltransferase family 4 protein [Vibrio parahaemolyticus]